LIGASGRISQIWFVVLVEVEKWVEEEVRLDEAHLE
jgi:hypothetical protein